MNKIRVIDLLNKIAKGEEVPKKIKYEDIVFDYTKRNREGLIYIADEYSNYEDNDNFLSPHLFWHIEKLNDEVEIIEEDKKIENFYFSVYQDQKLGGRDVVQNLEKKINELIDEVNKLKEK